MSNLALTINVDTATAIVGIGNTTPQTIPALFLDDTVNLSQRFVSGVGQSGGNLVDIDYSAAAIEVGLGSVGVVPTTGTFSVTDSSASQTATGIAVGASAATLQAALRAALTTNWSTCTVVLYDGLYVITNGSNGAQTTLQGGAAFLFPPSSVVIEPVQTGTGSAPSIQTIGLFQSPVALQTSFTKGPGYTAGVIVANVQVGVLAVTAVSAVQSIALTGSIIGGTFTITSSTDSLTTSALAYGASAATVQAAMAGYTVTGSGTTVAPYAITRTAPGPISALTANVSGLTLSSPSSTSLDSATGLQAVHTLTITGSPSGGGFVIKSPTDGMVTTSLDHAATAATVQAAMPGYTVLEGSAANIYIITRTATGAILPLTSTNTFSGGSSPGVTITNGAAPFNEVQTLTMTGSPGGGTFTVTDTAASQTTGTIAYDATTAVVQTAIRTLTTNWGAATVTGSAGAWVVNLGVAGPMPLLTADSSGLTGGTSPTVTPSETTHGVIGVNAVGTITITGSPTGGTFAITSSTDSLTTSGLAYNANNTTVGTAMPGYTVTGSAGAGYVITRTATGSITPLTCNTASLTVTAAGDTIANVTTGVTAVAGINAVQSMTLTGNPYAGTFFVNFNGGTSSAIGPAYSASQIQAALQSSTSIGAGNCSVASGDSGAVNVTFTGTLGLAPQNLMTVVSSLVGPLTMVGKLALNTGALMAAMGDSDSIPLTLEIKVTPAGGSPITVLQTVVTIKNIELVGGSTTNPPAGIPFATAQNSIINKIGSITALSSGAGTLSGMATAGGWNAGVLGVDACIIFTVSAIPEIWVLLSGTTATGAGIQRPDDYDGSTNAVIWTRII